MTARVATFVAALCTLLVVAGAPAQASSMRQWPELVVSHHGTTWKANLARPLFRGEHRWTPGESASRKFFARNQSGEDARLSVVVRVADRTAWLRRGDLRMAVAVKGRWRPVVFTGPTAVRSMVVRAGDVVPVQVRIRVLPGASDQKPPTPRRSMRFWVKLRLTELRA